MIRRRLARARGYWLLGGVWLIILGIGLDPAAAIATVGFDLLVVGLLAATVVELLAIRASVGRDPDWRQVAGGVGAVTSALTEAH